MKLSSLVEIAMLIIYHQGTKKFDQKVFVFCEACQKINFTSDRRYTDKSGPILFSFNCYESWGYQRYSYPHGLLKIILKKMTRKVLFAVCVVSQEPHAICMQIA